VAQVAKDAQLSEQGRLLALKPVPGGVRKSGPTDAEAHSREYIEMEAAANLQHLSREVSTKRHTGHPLGNFLCNTNKV
jgi:hypothetical protein